MGGTERCQTAVAYTEIELMNSSPVAPWASEFVPFDSNFSVYCDIGCNVFLRKKQSWERTAVLNTEKRTGQTCNLSAGRAFFPKLSLVGPGGQVQDLRVLMSNSTSGIVLVDNVKPLSLRTRKHSIYNGPLLFLLQPPPPHPHPAHLVLGCHAKQVFFTVPRHSGDSSEQADERTHQRL